VAILKEAFDRSGGTKILSTSRKMELFFGSNYPGFPYGSSSLYLPPNPPMIIRRGTVNIEHSAAVGDSVETQLLTICGLLYNVNIKRLDDAKLTMS